MNTAHRNRASWTLPVIACLGIAVAALLTSCGQGSRQGAASGPMTSQQLCDRLTPSRLQEITGETWTYGYPGEERSSSLLNPFQEIACGWGSHDANLETDGDLWVSATLCEEGQVPAQRPLACF
jgi:hypothetical protein